MDEPPGSTPTLSPAPDDGLEAVVPSRLVRAAARPSPLGLFRAGWGTAAARAFLAAAVAGAVAEIAVVLAAAAGRSTAAAATVARTGGVLFLAFNHVGVVLRPTASLAGRSPFGLIRGLDVAISFTPMLGTAIAGWMLWVGGRAVGNDAGGPGWLKGLHGTKVALPYAAVCLGLSYVVAMTVAVPGAAAGSSGGSVVLVHPSHVGAFLWPLAIGVVAGFSGGLGSGAPRGLGEGAGSPLDRRMWSAVSGGWRMLLWGLALAFAGLLLLGAVRPNVTRAYVGEMFEAGPVRGAGLTGLNVLVTPNLAAWALFPSMGACVAGSASFSSSGATGSVSLCLVSYRAFGLPGAGLDAVRRVALSRAPAPRPPDWAFLFLLVPLAAVMLGGRWAAGRVGAANRRRGAMEGATAGLAFGVLATGVAAVSEVAVRLQATGSRTAGALGSGGQLRLGPYVLTAGAVALAWGVSGGALGGFLARPVRDREPHLGLPAGPPDAPGL